MDPNQKTDDTEYAFELADEETAEVSVDDFIRELEAKEKDLHITADTTFIEIASEFDEGEVPDFMRQELAKKTSQTVKPAAPATEGSSAKKLESELAELKSKIAGMQEERTELYKNSQRRLKDFEAYKSRTERERSETFQRQLSNLATQMLPVLDNMDRALDSASSMSDEKQNEFAQFFNGIVLVNQQLNEVLVGMGIDPIATVGEQFDPHFHEAVAIDETSEKPPNTITAELLRGFRIGNKVIRHSMVKVSKAAAKSIETGTSQAEQDDDMDFDEADTQMLSGGGPAVSSGTVDSADGERIDFDMSYGSTATSGFEIERNGATGQGAEDED
ncbi:MAG: nucleotide exchange factor GrpE [Acidobacteria bacterium]|nr:nucleotide exchange factor GrpE [Acidobacteriota bacterium]